MNMKTVTLLNRAVLATACAALTLSTVPTNATDTPDVRVGAIRANAGITFVFTPTADPNDVHGHREWGDPDLAPG